MNKIRGAILIVVIILIVKFLLKMDANSRETRRRYREAKKEIPASWGQELNWEDYDA